MVCGTGDGNRIECGTIMAVDPRAVVAANNNADLYEAVFRSHGLNYSRLPYAFVGADRPPPYYSNLTVLAPGYADVVLEQLDRLARQFDGSVGLKDSFSELDLRDNGFSVLFEASWIWRPPGMPTPPSDWHVMEDAADLALWEQAWKAAGSPTERRMFCDAMLDLPDIRFLGLKVGDVVEAGCIANVSGDCIGLSNVFSRSMSGDAFTSATEAVAAVEPAYPIVGYESDGHLAHACAAGFQTVGNLRILVAKDASFKPL